MSDKVEIDPGILEQMKVDLRKVQEDLSTLLPASMYDITLLEDAIYMINLTLGVEEERRW